MKILFVCSEGLPYSKTGGLADVVEALPKALREMGHEVAVLLPRYRGNKITSTLVSSVTHGARRQLRFPAIAEGQSRRRRPLFFRGRSGIFRSRATLRRQERRLSGQRGALRRIFARGDRIHEARLAAGRDSLPRLAIGARAGAAAHAACGRSRRAFAAGGFDDSQSRLPGLVPADGAAKDRAAGNSVHDRTRSNFTGR